MAETARTRLEGTVVEVLPSAMFRVEVPGRGDVRAHMATELRLRAVRVLPGDAVTVELSAYDAGRGRIVERKRS